MKAFWRTSTGVIDLDDTSDADELPLASEPTIAEELAPMACPPVLLHVRTGNPIPGP